MKKRLSVLVIVLMCLFMVSCAESDDKKSVIWNDIDLTYWQENSRSDGHFTVAIMKEGHTASGQEMNTQVLKVLADIYTEQHNMEDYFSYVENKEYYGIQFIRSEKDGGSIYIIFTDDFTVMAVFDNLTENRQSGVLNYPEPSVYTVTDCTELKDLFAKYDFIL